MTTPPNAETLNKGLLIAVETNNLDLAHWIFAQSADCPNNLKQCLLAAIEKGNKEMIAILTEKCKTPPTPTPTPTKRQLVKVHGNFYVTPNLPAGEVSAWMKTVLEDHTSALKELSEGTISVEEINDPCSVNWTPLMYLARNGADLANVAPLMQKMLDLGADVNYQNSSQDTALMIACQYKCSAVVEILLKHPNIDVNLKNKLGLTALMGAASCALTYGAIKNVELLMNHPKIIINDSNKTGWTAFMSACGNMPTDNTQVVELFLKNLKLDINARHNGGQTAFDLMPHLPEMFKLFMTRPDFVFNGPVTFKSLKGLTPDEKKLLLELYAKASK